MTAPPGPPASPHLVLWRVLGLALGIVGALLPLLPSVVFFLLAAWAFGKGAPAWRQRLHDHPRYGPPLRQWADGGRVSRRGKRLAVSAMAASFLLSLVMLGPGIRVAVAGVVLAAVGTWLWRRPEPVERGEPHPISAVLTGVLDRFRVRRDLPPLGQDERLDGKVALVTGGASGLGFATSVDLARRGARVLVADRRDLEQAQRRVVALGVAPDRIELVHLDLSDLAAIERCVAELAHRGVRIDRLVLNAAIVPTSARSTPQGLDEMFAVNYLSSFALVTRLLDRGVLPRDREPGDVPRIVLVASEAHRWSEDLVLDGLDRPRDGSPRHVLAWYATYKLMLVTFGWELARRCSVGGTPRISVFALCPGAMRTNIARELPAALRAPLGAVMRLLFQDPFVADEPVIFLACSRAMEGRTAVYLHKMARKEVDARAAQAQTGRALWERSEILLAKSQPLLLAASART